MACNICGLASHEATTAGCPDRIWRKEHRGKPPIGWLCPACHKGNAPDAKTCGHCATGMACNVTNWMYDQYSSRKFSFRRAGDMKPIS